MRPEVAADARRVADAFDAASERLIARGLTLVEPPRVVVYPDARTFAIGTGQHDPGLRAWTNFKTLHFMPLATWAHSDDAAVRQRLAHELCHASIYQHFGSEQRAKAAKIPRFFEEGVCSVVAGQDRVDVVTIVTVAPPMPYDAGMFRADPEVAYAAAHHAIELLDEKLGPLWLNAVLDQAAKDGTPGCVERALYDVTGFTPETLWRAVVDASSTPV